MKVISVLNQKGGVGKTTISIHLARAIELSGKSVALVDSDPQGTARDWNAANEDSTLTVVGIDRPTIDKDIKNLLSDRDYVIIDGAPSIESLSVSAIKASDVIIIPVQPSPFDVWATNDLVDLIKQRIEITEGRLQAFFVVSRAIKGTSIANEVHDALNELELPVLNSVVHQKVDKKTGYLTAVGRGLTVMEINPNGDESKEINNLLNEIISKL